MEYVKKRLTHGLLINFLLLTAAIHAAQQPIVPLVYNTIPVVKDLQLQTWISKSRIFMVPIILSIVLCCSSKTLQQNINDHPLFFLAASYLTGNYVIDSVCKYRQLSQTLHFFKFSQKMSRYMLCIFGIKNNMKKWKEMHHLTFDEEEFFKKINAQTGHNIQQLEIFTFELLNSSIQAIRNLCVDINTTDIEEKIYYVFKDHITLEQMLIICKDDPVLHYQLVQFYNNPEQNYEKTLQLLCSLINDHFNVFIKKKLHFI